MSIRDTNIWHPLPADYGDLTVDGQRQARLALVCDHSTPEKFVTAWDAFRRFYLQSTEPGFFYDDLVESPSFHYEILNDIGMYPFNVFAAPRGFGKSTLISLELPLFLSLTRPYFKMSLGFSTDKGIEKQLSKMMIQFEGNSFILEDFGKMKPNKGGKIWNRHCLNLENGSVIDGFSVEGKKRGARPHLFILDDPEYYDDGSESRASIIHDQFNKVLFKEILPMLRPGCSIAWIGTVINMRSFIYYACTSDDSRFKKWNRKIFTAFDSDSNSLWQEMWSDDALEARREEIGDAAFSSEYMNTPCSDQDRLLDIDEVHNEYSVDGYNKDVYNPDSRAIAIKDTGITHYNIRNKDKDTVEIKENFDHLMRRTFRVLTLDYAEGLKSNNDFSCIAITGYTSDNCMWVLDLWMGRVRRTKLLKLVYDYAYKWQVRAIGIEAVGLQKELVESAEDFLGESVGESSIFRPPVIPITYKQGQSKANRIASLQWRYSKGKIKYPSHLKDTFAVRNLYDQTRDFTMDLAFLRHDDAIDSVAMSQYMIKNKGVKTEETAAEPSVIEKLTAGTKIENGVSLANSLSTQHLTNSDLHGIVMARQEKLRAEKIKSVRTINRNIRTISRR